MIFLFLFSFSPPFPSVTPDWDLVGCGAFRQSQTDHVTVSWLHNMCCCFKIRVQAAVLIHRAMQSVTLDTVCTIVLVWIFGSRNPSVAQYIFVCLPRQLSFLTVPQFLRHVQNWWQNGSKSLLKVISLNPLNSSIKNVYVVTPKNVHSTRMWILKAEWLNNKKKKVI